MKNHFRWEKGFDSKFLLNTIREARTIQNGRVSMDGWVSAFWTPALSSAIGASSEALRLKDQCITKVIFNADCNLETPEQFIDDCQAALLRLNTRALEKYFLLCSLTYDGMRLFDRLSDNECTLIWQLKTSNARYRKAIQERRKVSDILGRYNLEEPAHGMTHVMIEVQAASPQEATEKAFDGIDRFRGIINLIANGARGLNIWGFGSSAPQAVNRLRRGPYSTIHYPDGKLASEIVWYEPRWFHGRTSIKFSATEEQVQRDIKRWWNQASSGPLKDHVGRGLIRYCQALDDHDPSMSLLRLWAVLEMLSGTSNAKYDVLVSRVVKLFSDAREARQVAEHIRKRRNENAHTATALDERHADAVVHQAELLCGKLLRFCIVEGRKFQNVAELFEFLDNDLDLSALKRRQKISSEFVAYRTKIETSAKRPKSPVIETR